MSPIGTPTPEEEAEEAPSGSHPELGPDELVSARAKELARLELAALEAAKRFHQDPVVPAATVKAQPETPTEADIEGIRRARMELEYRMRDSGSGPSAPRDPKPKPPELPVIPAVALPIQIPGFVAVPGMPGGPPPPVPPPESEVAITPTRPRRSIEIRGSLVQLFEVRSPHSCSCPGCPSEPIASEGHA